MKTKKIDLEQGSQKWLSYRRCHITATDTASLMNLSPWSTPYKIYQEKIEGLETEVNSAMQRGKDLEPIARAKLESIIGEKLEPAVYEADEFPYMSASLDALNADGTKLYEIKTCGHKTMENAKAGRVPEHYRIQCTKQMLVMGLSFMWLFFYENDDDYAIVPVPRDPELVEQIIDTEHAFWNNHIIPRIPPPMTFRDWEIRDNTFENNLASSWAELKEEEEEATRKRKVVEAQLKELCEGKSVHYKQAGVKVQQISRKGVVDWDKVCLQWEISKEELEKYRKEKSSYVKIRSEV